MELLRALLYTCSSFPKICAPHRLSLSDEFERCMVTGFAALEPSKRVAEGVERVERGEIDLGSLGLGKAMAEALSRSAHELGHRMVVEIALAMPVASALSKLMDGGRALGDAMNALRRAAMLSTTEDALCVVDALRRLGGEYALIVERADLSDRRILVENMKLLDVVNQLSNHSRAMSQLFSSSDAVAMLSAAREGIKKGVSVVHALSRAFVSRALEELGISERIDDMHTARGLARIAKLDRELRGRGVRMTHLLIPLLYASIQLVKEGL